MTLHTVNKHHLNSDCLQRCLDCSLAGDSLLLIEDGVFNALQSSSFEALWQADLTIYVLDEDCQARGISALLSERVKLVDYAGFVTLTEDCAKTVSWY